MPSRAALPAVHCTRGGDPRQHCLDWLDGLAPEDQSLLLVEFELPCSWLKASPAIPLTALYLRRDANLEIAVTDSRLHPGMLGPAEQFDDWVARHRLFVANPGQVLPLRPLEVAKPWGREFWFTGAEQRGICEFGIGEHKTPQPWLLAALPGVSDEQGYKPPAQLKILDPLAEPVTGDLYFELHDVKQEVYVVTHVDRRAWPDGVGYLRFGFCPRRMAASESEARFRRDYLDAVLAYRNVRDQLDALPEKESPAIELTQRERRLRAAMEEFVLFRPVRVGDVVEVPSQLPHGLLHGVRVVEFQTPVFERKILSFSQRVLTQSHWDTEQVVGRMRLSGPIEAPAKRQVDRSGSRFESVANPPGFEVRRLILVPGESITLSTEDGHALMIVLQGSVRLSGHCFGPEQAGWLPGKWQGELAVPQGQDEAVLLLALARA